MSKFIGALCMGAGFILGAYLMILFLRNIN